MVLIDLSGNNDVIAILFLILRSFRDRLHQQMRAERHHSPVLYVWLGDLCSGEDLLNFRVLQACRKRLSRASGVVRGKAVKGVDQIQIALKGNPNTAATP
jgi:hypothetical protein